MKRSALWLTVALVVTGGLGLVVPQGGETFQTWLVLAPEGADLTTTTASVEAAGGTVVRTCPQIGLVVASTSDPDFAAALATRPGVEAAGIDVRSARISGATATFGVAGFAPLTAEDAKNPPESDDDPLFRLQWGLDAVDAPEAWELGATGAGVRVAVLDTGLNPDHPDLAANVNTTLCASFVSGEDWNVMTAPNPGYTSFAHGTHVAGIIAAADNAAGVIGVAPEAEIVAVKVLSQYTGYGTWGMVIEGILYAADIDADVINMSLGGDINRRGGWDDNGTPDTDDDVWFTASDVAATVNALKRAVAYAHASGAVVVAAAGNSAIDGDHDRDLVSLPAQLPKVLAISATAPIGYGLDPTVDLDNLASYSNYGQSEIDFAAPGGDDMNYPAALYFRDYVIGAVPLGWAWFAGTSMAAPHASGVAALIVGEYPGLRPAQVEARMRQGADDLGKPGRDDAYGHGRVNAYESVR